MYLNYKGTMRLVSVFMMVIATAMIPSVLVGIIYGETSQALVFSAVCAVIALAGFVLSKIFKNAEGHFKIREGFMVVFSCWILAGLLGAMPYYFSGCGMGLIDSIFESVSGFTTTGATVTRNVEALPHSILFWRAFTQWLGGFGIVFVPIALLPALGIEGYSIVRAEMSGTIVNKVVPKLSDSARRMIFVLTVFTFLETILLMFGGLSFFDALTHSFTTISTGGFSNYTDNLGHFGSNYVYCVFSVFMFLAGIDVSILARILSGNFRDILAEQEPRYYAGLFAFFTGIITVFIIVSGVERDFFRVVAKSAFHVLATMTTCGFYSADFDIWPTFAKLLLLCLAVIGGCISSTSGGIKVFRFIIFIKMIKRGAMLRLHPNAVYDVKFGERKVSSEIIQSVTGFLFLYILLLVIGTAALTFAGTDTLHSFVAVLACINNLGPALLLGSNVLNYGFFHGIVKILLCFIMLAGRLELTTAVVIFSKYFWNPNRSR